MTVIVEQSWTPITAKSAHGVVIHLTCISNIFFLSLLAFHLPSPLFSPAAAARNSMFGIPVGRFLHCCVLGGSTVRFNPCFQILAVFRIMPLFTTKPMFFLKNRLINAYKCVESPCGVPQKYFWSVSNCFGRWKTQGRRCKNKISKKIGQNRGKTPKKFKCQKNVGALQWTATCEYICVSKILIYAYMYIHKYMYMCICIYRYINMKYIHMYIYM